MLMWSVTKTESSIVCDFHLGQRYIEGKILQTTRRIESQTKLLVREEAACW